MKKKEGTYEEVSANMHNLTKQRKKYDDLKK